MPAEFGIVHPLWDFAADEGRLLERAAGEVGLNHVTVPVVSGAQTQFRLGTGGETPHFHTDGGWHYRASTKAYAGAPFRPPKAQWFAGGDVLARLRARVAELNLRLMLRIDLRATRAIVDHHRHMCQRNAWGQEVPFAGACASHPDLRELLRATLEDLGRYEPAGYELVDWAPDVAVDRAVTRPFAWHPPVRRLLDICFCASCRQIAERENVDADQAARSVRVEVERVVAAPTDAVGAAADEPAIAAYVAARNADCCDFLVHLAENDGERRRLLLKPFAEPLPGNCAPWVRLARLPAGAAGPPESEVWQARGRALTEIAALALPLWRPTFAETAELVRFVSEAVKAGVGFFDFEGLSEATADVVTWLRQAVRFARREG